jgi:hypothetical protein
MLNRISSAVIVNSLCWYLAFDLGQLGVVGRQAAMIAHMINRASKLVTG